MNKSHESLDSNSQTNLYQKNFDGSTNVYAPHIYHSPEQFAPVNLYDDTLSPY